mgnify:CR=1 FL=1
MAMSDEDKAWFKQLLAEQSEVFEAKLEAVETKLLTAFHQWASPVDTRLRAHSAAIRALEVEQEALRDRVDKLEGSGSPPVS